MQGLGRLLQLVGLTVLPLAMFLELSNGLGREFHLSEMVIMLVFGVSAFLLGRMSIGWRCVAERAGVPAKVVQPATADGRFQSTLRFSSCSSMAT